MEGEPILKKTLYTMAVMLAAWTAFMGTISVVAVLVTTHAVAAPDSSSSPSTEGALQTMPPSKGTPPPCSTSRPTATRSRSEKRRMNRTFPRTRSRASRGCAVVASVLASVAVFAFPQDEALAQKIPRGGPRAAVPASAPGAATPAATPDATPPAAPAGPGAPPGSAPGAAKAPVPRAPPAAFQALPNGKKVQTTRPASRSSRTGWNSNPAIPSTRSRSRSRTRISISSFA